MPIKTYHNYSITYIPIQNFMQAYSTEKFSKTKHKKLTGNSKE